LGIARLRPGRNSNPNSPNPANYDPAKANPYPKLPEVLETEDGRKVTTPEQLYRRDFGESLENLATTGGYHWMAGSYLREKMPAVNEALLDGALAWRQHDGGHTDGPNVQHFIRWARGQWGKDKRQDARSVDTPVERRDSNSRVAHHQLVAKTKQGKIDVYFEGDSITRRWGATDYPKLLAHWEKHFHGWNAANFGWGGDTTHNILWRLQNGELDGVSPKIIVLQAGTNNLPWSGAADDAAVDDVVGGIKAIIATFQKETPHAVVVLTALFPRPQSQTLAPTIERINDQLKTLADGKKIRFVNINDRLTDDKGNLLPGVSRDGLHLEEKGYDVWATALKPIFAELLGPPAKMDQAPPPTGDPSATQRPAPSARP
jgi:(4-O-methyl)-D-glucuronate---lignin esterase